MRKKLRRLVQHNLFEVVVALAITISIGLMIPEICLTRDHPGMKWVDLGQNFLTLFFVVELALRFLAARRKRRFFSEFWLDLLALVPLLRVARFFRLLRLLRLYRLAGVASRNSALQSLLLGRASEYALVVFFLLFCLTTGTLGLTHFENPNAGLGKLAGNFWVSLFTVAQSEYANQLPDSVGGKLVLLGLELCGLTFFAVLTATTSAFLLEKLRDGTVLQRMHLDDLEDHVMICGWNSGLESTIKQLQHHPNFCEREFVVIADRPELPELADLPFRHKVRLIRDDFTRVEVLQRCNVAQASVALIVSDIAQGRSRQDADARTVMAALTIEKLNPQVYTCAELSNAMNESHLRMGKVNEVVITQDLAGHLLARAAVSPSSWRALHELVQPSGSRPGFTSYPVTDDLVGRDFAALVSDWIGQKGILLVGVYRPSGETLLNPRRYSMAAGDELVGIPAEGGK
ncbi:ion transporter [bacterium]|nr:ion transporter [bacterium]